MKYLKRKIDLYLESWFKDNNRKPLIVKGARQIGKSESVREFANKFYSNVIEINFIESPQFKNILDGGYSADNIIKNITRINPSLSFVPGSTLIFFDEIQAIPDIVTSLKFFCIDGRYDVICSGSLLGINYKQIESISVGYKTDCEMFSLDFEEFLWAKGYGDELRNDLLDSMIKCEALNKPVFGTLLNHFMD